MRKPNTHEKTGWTTFGLRPHTLRLGVVAVAVAACFSGSYALANPTVPAVVNGTASFAAAGNILNITNSPNAIINWGSFSIGVNELTRFIQQSGSSAVLNRVIGQDPSAILGSLQSNGRVFLINPNGIVFGSGAQVNVAGLVASTLNLSNDDFLNNRMKFTDGAGAGSVVNQGSITGGSVYLIGKAVTNDGLITSPNGDVILAAGNSVELVNPGTPNLRVEIVAPDNEAQNLGSITADAGRIGIYAGLIQQSGTLRADSAVVEGGRILLKATKNVALAAASQTTASGTSGGRVDIQAGDTAIVEGDINATGSTGAGGTVQVLGNLVGLVGHAGIDASGDTAGGTVLVGGDYQGKNPEVQNAFRTYVGPDVTIHADAITAGDGGKVIVWADDVTRYYGKISARGGANGGDGGFAEVSGKRVLDFQGTANLRAAHGATGTLLLDPDNIDINATTGLISGLLETLLSPGTFTDGQILFGEASGQDIAIAPSVLNASMANIVLQANKDITVTDAISLANDGVTLTMQAGGYLNVNGSITTRGGALTLVAGDTGGTASVGSLNINAGLDTTGAGAIASGAGITLVSNLSDVGGTSLRINAPVNAGTAGNILITDTNFNIEQTNLGVITGHGLWAQTTNGDVLLDTAFNQVDHFAASASGIVKLKNARNLHLEDVDGNQGIIVLGSNAGGNVQLALIDSGGTYYDLTADSGSTIIANGGGTTAVKIDAKSIGEVGNQYITVNPGSSGSVNLRARNGGIYVEQVAGTMLTSRYALTVDATNQMIELVSSGGPLQVDGSLNFPTADFALETKGSNNISFQGSGTITAANFTLEPDSSSGSVIFTGSPSSWIFNTPVTVTGSRPVTFSGAADATFNSTFSASGSTVTVGSGNTLNLAGGATSLTHLVNSGAVTAAGDLTVTTDFDWSGGTIGGTGLLITPNTATTDITGSVALAPGKTWNNAGTVNFSGASTLDLGDTTAAIFNNQAGGVVNIGSSAGWSFISDPSSQVGQINNAGTINVNNSTSWEAAFNNAAGATLNIAAGQYVSMQNGQSVAGTVNIGAGGTLWVSEWHGTDTFFNGTTIGGSGTLQVIGSGPVAKLTNVNASNAILRLGSGGQLKVLNGTSTFAALNLDSPSYGGGFSISNGVFAQSAGDLIVPVGATYSGNAGYVAQGGNLIVNGLVNAAYGGANISLEAVADVMILGGGDVSGATVKLKGANVLVGDSTSTAPASVYATSLLDIIAGDLAIEGGSGSGASALVSSSGVLTVAASGDVILAGGAGANAWAKLSGNPDAVLSSVGGVIRMDAGSGTGSYAAIESVSPTSIYVTFPNLASGGYFVNGVEGTVYDAGTGFIAGGSPAILGTNLIVTYGGSVAAGSDALEAPNQILIVALGESTKPPDAEKEKDVFKESEDDKKKDAPVCK